LAAGRWAPPGSRWKPIALPRPIAGLTGDGGRAREKRGRDEGRGKSPKGRGEVGKRSDEGSERELEGEVKENDVSTGWGGKDTYSTLDIAPQTRTGMQHVPILQRAEGKGANGFLASLTGSIVVRTLVSAGELSRSCARLLAGWVTTLWLSRPLLVSLHSQLSHPSLRGR